MEVVFLPGAQLEEIEEKAARAYEHPRKGTSRHFETTYRFVPLHAARGFKEPVRRHSMRETLRKKRWDASLRTKREATQARSNFDKFIARSEDACCKNSIPTRTSSSSMKRHRQLIERQPKPNDAAVETTERDEHAGKERSVIFGLLDGGKRDPFDSLPCDPGLEEYFDEYLGLDNRVFGISPGSTVRPVRDFSFHLAIDSAATLAAISAYGAACKGDRTRGLLTLKAKAFCLVNQGLMDVNDQLTLAVTLLWILESRFGSIQARQIHALGLQQMILLRGGFAALDFTLQMQLAWCIITLPEPLNLSPESDSSFTQTYFNTFLLFTESVNSIVTSNCSPYDTDINVFATQPTFRLLLSGAVPSRGTFESSPRLYSLCRLTILLYIHAIFVENAHHPENLLPRLQKVMNNLLEIGKPEVYTIEMLTLLIFKEGKKNAFEDQGRALVVLQMITIIKRLSSRTIEKLLHLFFGYLVGYRFSGEERAELWNVGEMKEEAFSLVDCTSRTWWFAAGG